MKTLNRMENKIRWRVEHFLMKWPGSVSVAKTDTRSIGKQMYVLYIRTWKLVGSPKSHT